MTLNAPPYCRTLTCIMAYSLRSICKTKYEMSSSICSKDMAWSPKCRNESHDPDHAPFRDNLSSAGCNLLPSTYRTNLKFFSYTHYENMKSGIKCGNWGSLGWLGVTEGHRRCESAYNFLFDFNRNCTSYLYRF